MENKPAKLSDSTKPLDELFQSSSPVTGLRFVNEDILQYNLHELDFDGCEFAGCVFDESTIRGSRFVACRFNKCDFKETTFSNCRFGEGNESSACIWTNCNLAEAKFEDCNLGLNKFVKCSAYMTAFRKCAASGLQFEADVHKKVSARLVMGGVIFEECRLQYATFREKNYSESKFEKCDLRDVSFWRSDLTNCSFVGSALNNIDFDGAVLDRAAITYATFDEFKLDGMASYAGMFVSREQQQVILKSMGIIVVGK